MTKDFFLDRWKIYFKERFPILMYLILVTVLFIGMNALSRQLAGLEIVVNQYTIAGIISGVLLMLLVRTFDDIKDEELDRGLFPNRPVSRGAVLISDVKMLALLSFVLLVAINIFMAPNALMVFGSLMIYLLLTFKWFFLKELHVQRPKIAMITHQPIPSAIIFYLIYMSLAGNEKSAFEWIHFYLLLSFALPITAWEVSRKTRSKDKEDDYQTFSKIFGTTAAGLIPIILYFISTSCMIIIGNSLRFHYLFSVLLGVNFIIAAWFYLRFIINPNEKNSQLQTVSLFFTSSYYALIFAFTLWNYHSQIQLDI
ncbi:MAG: UbiA family prenyltransferase [Bacteroidales bacterium]|nr:UbiA family prenyltransferase [Bacteroidales bacterium]